MNTIVLIGGSGYIGKEFARQLLETDPNVIIYIVTRTARSASSHTRVRYVSIDFTSPVLNDEELPKNIDAIIDFVGGPESNPDLLATKNAVPVDNMIMVADKHHIPVIGFVGGSLGPKTFVEIKKSLLKKLKETGKKVVYVEPTLVYGMGRKDDFTKLVPALKFFGIFNSKMKPVRVEEVAKSLVSQLLN